MIKKIIIFIILFLIIVAGIYGLKKDEKVVETGIVASNPSTFVTPEKMYGILSNLKEPENLQAKVCSGVVPHHLLAGHIIARFMESIKDVQKPETIIIIGPNHPNKGARIITGLNSWQTPEGLVKTDEKIINALLEKHLAVQGEDILAKEHSIGNIVPFIKHYLPETKVVPIIFHHSVKEAEIDNILNILDKYLGEDDLVLASVDFSHYLTRKRAEEMDQRTIKAIKDFDYNTLSFMGNDNLDSPPSLIATLKRADIQKSKSCKILDHTNSGVILKNDLIETTSYFSLVFYKKTFVEN